MKKTSCIPMLHFFALTLFLQLFFYLSLSENPFGKCLTKKCGDVDISYPFHIVNQQEKYCGYPGFEVSCENDHLPHMNISGDTYVIKNISYDYQTFQVMNSVFVTSVKSQNECFRLPQNLTFDYDVFNYAADYKEISLLLNCSPEVFRAYKEEPVVVCGTLGVYGNGSTVKELEGKCDGVIQVPYEVQIANKSSLREVLEEGFSLKWTTNNCSVCTVSGGQCGFDQSISEFSCFCHDRTHSHQCQVKNTNSRRSKLFIIGAGASALGISVLTALVICGKRKLSGNKLAILGMKGTLENKNVEAFLKSYGSLAPKRYTYAEIRKMTNSFKDKLGGGGYGIVYKGILGDGRFVAVKKLTKLKGNGEDFLNEVVSISRTNHVNVVTLLGFCFERKKRALVYEFQPHGSLDKFVFGAKCGQPLQWETLFNISVGIARGLDYLHRGCNTRILHFDIKPHNILLGEDFSPKISDFGLAKLCLAKDSIVSMLEARGTIGYIAPEVYCRNFGGVSHKSDVYSYGMMVLDIACGRKDMSTEVQGSSDLYFPEWIYKRLELGEEVAANHILNDNDKGLQRKMILVSLWCIQTYPSNRPSMHRVVEMLDGPLESLQMPPKPYASSLSRSVSGSSMIPILST